MQSYQETKEEEEIEPLAGEACPHIIWCGKTGFGGKAHEFARCLSKRPNQKRSGLPPSCTVPSPAGFRMLNRQRCV